MSVFSNRPGSCMISGVRGQGSNVKSANIAAGKRSKYFKIIYVSPRTRHTPPTLCLVADIIDNAKNQKRADKGNGFVRYPKNMFELEKLKHKYYLSPELEDSILKKM